MASNLLKKFPGVEDIVANIELISQMKFRGAKRIQSLVDEHQHILPMTKHLTNIVTDAEFKVPKQELRWHGINDDAMINMFNFLGASASRRERWYQLQPVV